MLDKKPDAASDPTYVMCKAFLQFELHGAIISEDATPLETAGFLSSKQLVFPPNLRSTKLYKITYKGRKGSSSFWELWLKWYVPHYGLESDKIEDVYSTETSDSHLWAFNDKRLEKEREAGRLDQALKRAL